jgi:DNA-binding MarR family transcriptional regulator
MAESDAVDRIVEQWRRELPDLELEPMATFGRIHRISQKLWGGTLNRVYGEYGLGRGEFDVLATIRRSGETTLSPKQISTSLMLSSGGLTGRLDKLENAGFIERLPDPADRRALRVRITDKGRETIEAAVRAGLDAQAELLGKLSSEDREQLGALLRRLHIAFETEPFE